MEHTKESLIDLFKQNYKDKLPEWYCQLNGYKIPEDFPIPLKLYESNKEAHEDPLMRITFAAISEALGREAQSKAWWTIELGRTEEEWQTWWNNGCKYSGEYHGIL